MRRTPRWRDPSGFTLVELGIVLGVIAVLVMGAIIGRGYLDAARERSAADLVNTIRIGSRQWSQRNRNSLDFSGISLAALQSGGMIPSPLTTPWRSPTIVVVPDGSSAGCVGETCVRICVEMPGSAGAPVVCNDTRLMMTGVVSASCDAGAACGLSGTWKLNVVSR